PPARARRRPGRPRPRARSPLRTGLGDRRGRSVDLPRALGRARERGDAARRARTARAAVQRPPAANVHARARSRAARRSLGRGDWDTVAAHRAAIQEHRAELDHLYETLAGATLALAT